MSNSDKEIKQVISEAVNRLNESRKSQIKEMLNEVEFKIDLLDHNLGYYKKFERALKKVKSYLKKAGIDYTRGMGYSVSTNTTSSHRDGESKQRTKTTARLKLDKFEEKVKAADCTITKCKKEISDIITGYGLEIVDIKNRENKPEEIIFTIKL
jgi:hypothetical protein